MPDYFGLREIGSPLVHLIPPSIKKHTACQVSESENPFRRLIGSEKMI